MKLYFRYLAKIIKSQMEYKASFLMTTLGQFLVSFTAFVGLYFMFDRFHTVRGFEMAEVMLCFAVVLMSFSLTECFVRGFDVFPRLIRSGEFDRILLRPRSEVFQVLTSNIELARVGRAFQAILMLVYAMPASGVVWSGDKILTLILMLVGGIAVFSSLFVLYAGFSFFTIEGLEFMNIFTDGSREFAKYPLSIYGEGILKFLTYVIPIALFQYYPFLYLIGHSSNPAMIFVPLLGIIFLLPCTLFYKFGVRRYKSTGS